MMKSFLLTVAVVAASVSAYGGYGEAQGEQSPRDEFFRLLTEHPASQGSISLINKDGVSTRSATGAEIQTFLHEASAMETGQATRTLVGFGSASEEVRNATAWPYCYSVRTNAYYRFLGLPFQVEIRESEPKPPFDLLAPPDVCGVDARRWSVIYGGPGTTLVQLCGLIEVAIVTDSPLGGAGGSGCGSLGWLHASGVMYHIVFWGYANDFFSGSEGTLIIR